MEKGHAPHSIHWRAKRAADIGDVSQTVFHSQEAPIAAMQHLAEEVRALRQALAEGASVSVGDVLGL